VALGGVLLAFALFLVAGARAGWTEWTGGGWRLLLLGVGLAAWLTVLIPWRAGWNTKTPQEHQRGMYLALGAWAVTDLVVLVAWGAP
jgi:hypothetical protein